MSHISEARSRGKIIPGSFLLQALQQIAIAKAGLIRKCSMVTSSMDPKKCYQMLEEAGWFAGWPEAACQSAKKTIKENKEMRAEHGDHPGVAMISVWDDTECIDSEDAYTSILQNFANGSHGFFKPEEISEVWEELGEGEWSIEVSFKHGSKVYAGPMSYEGDWMDGAIVGLINQAMADCEPALVFTVPDIGFGQDYGCALIPAALAEPATQQGLFPKPQEMSAMGLFDDDEEEGEPSLTPILESYESLAAFEMLDVFEDCWGKLPDHLLSLVKRDLGAFAKAVEAGADINATGSNGMLSPLRIAIKDHFPEGIEYLLSRPDLDLNQRDHEGDTALSWAVELDQNDLAKRLIEAGADIHVINQAGENLIQLADRHANTEMSAFLKVKGVGKATG